MTQVIQLGKKFFCGAHKPTFNFCLLFKAKTRDVIRGKQVFQKYISYCRKV